MDYVIPNRRANPEDARSYWAWRPLILSRVRRGLEAAPIIVAVALAGCGGGMSRDEQRSEAERIFREELSQTFGAGSSMYSVDRARCVYKQDDLFVCSVPADPDLRNTDSRYSDPRLGGLNDIGLTEQDMLVETLFCDEDGCG